MNEDRVWSYAKGGATIGPHTETEIREMIRQGTITAKDVLFKTGWTEWKSAKETMPDAFAAAAPSPAPAPASSATPAAGAQSPAAQKVAAKMQDIADIKAPHIPDAASSAAESLIKSLPGGADSLATRRIVGWLVDFAIVFTVSIVVSVVMMILTGVLGKIGAMIASLVQCILALVFLAYFLCRDGMFGGRSLGKLVVGLRVVDEATGAPASMVQSIKRNLPLAIPCVGWIVAIICAFQLPTGYRWGDKWAGVVVKRA